MSIETDYATLRSVLTGRGPSLAIAPEPEGWAVEFGVYTGYSLGLIASHMPVIGFDSFEGLPEDWREGFSKGKFSLAKAPGIRAGFPPPKSMIVPGWFEDTVPSFPFPRLGLVHIDCDLYSSTVTALEGVTDAVHDGTIIVFDEFHSYPGAEDHEEKAFKEWLHKYSIEADLIAEGSGKHAQEAAFVLSQTRHV